ncbi:DUF2147 domain-containing protein [Bradyrhizobium sp. USDA 4469]
MSVNLRAIGIAMTLATLIAGSARAADANAIWIANEGQARIKVQTCGQNICGSIVWLADPLDPETGKAKLDKYNPNSSLRSQPIVGLRVLDARPEREGQWRGTIYNGQDGKTYNANVRLEGDVLKVEGCVLGSIFCRTQTWTRFN